jgi:hypothetical protein
MEAVTGVLLARGARHQSRRPPDDGRKSEARAELQKVIDAPFDPAWDPEDQEFKEKAKRLLRTLR